MTQHGPHICARCLCTMRNGVSVEHGLVTWDRGRVQLVATPAKIFEHLFSGRKTLQQIIDHLWGFDPNGGPLYADEIVRVQVYRLGKALKAAGFPGEVASIFGVGYEIRMRDTHDDTSGQRTEAASATRGADRAA